MWPVHFPVTVPLVSRFRMSKSTCVYWRSGYLPSIFFLFSFHPCVICTGSPAVCFQCVSARWLLFVPHQPLPSSGSCSPARHVFQQRPGQVAQPCGIWHCVAGHVGPLVMGECERTGRSPCQADPGWLSAWGPVHTETKTIVFCKFCFK